MEFGCSHSYTLEEIGAKFDLTKERVRQIKEKAIRRLRHNSRSKLLKSYLGLTGFFQSDNFIFQQTNCLYHLLC
jgi:hypothetical protein